MGRSKTAPEVEVPEPNLDPEALRAHDAKGNVRPADDRYLTEDQIAARDLHLEEVQTEDDKAAAEILRDAGSSAVPTTEEMTLDV